MTTSHAEPHQRESLERLRGRAGTSGIFLDFDGSLSEIVERPELARPLAEVPEVLEALAGRFALVAVVTGRPSKAVRELLPVPGLEVFGMYGLEDGVVPIHGGGARSVRTEVDRIAAMIREAWVEDKGESLAVHYRQAQDPDSAAATLGPPLEGLARTRGLMLLRGRMVLELAPSEVPGKGSVISEQCRARGLEGCLFAGDDAADLEAFAAMDRLHEDGLATVKIVVRSDEAPAELLGAADIVVDGPPGLLAVLHALAV